jgi:alkanesulfonate monooxygenase SsuD/methylene tetrahydromethanopterin reductase-like flavin-dependent oxidoreductase (luciferase family)
MRLGLSLAHSPIRERTELAREAEAGGFTSIWTEDSDALVSLTAMALATERISLGSGVVRAFARAPITLATAVANLQDLSNERLLLGIGTGTRRQNLARLGQEFDHPAPRVAELIALVRALLTRTPGEPAQYQGRFYAFTGAGSTSHKGRSPAPPVYLAAVNRHMLRVAGAHCEGLCGHPVFSVPYIEGPVLDNLGHGFGRGQVT